MFVFNFNLGWPKMLDARCHTCDRNNFLFNKTLQNYRSCWNPEFSQRTTQRRNWGECFAPCGKKNLVPEASGYTLNKILLEFQPPVHYKVNCNQPVTENLQSDHVKVEWLHSCFNLPGGVSGDQSH